eukprot:TRINITY_DN8108_c0_g1_i1.p1 TRINITY_DN8108_c0_g1~~TRINITY_DN8108_c0_g1_i1.p1  ORF type:complete len:481 (+),score=40.91 TRINITY_DN8108_c0_g1_i1:74-1444(+)
MSAQANAGTVVPEHEGYPSCLKNETAKKEFEDAEKNQRSVDNKLDFFSKLALGAGVLSIGCLGATISVAVGVVVMTPVAAFCGTKLIAMAAFGIGVTKTYMTDRAARLNEQQKKLLEWEIREHCNITVEIETEVEDNEDPSKVCETTVGSCWHGTCDETRGTEVECKRIGWSISKYCVCKPGYCSAYGQCVKGWVATKAVVDAEKAAAEMAKTARGGEARNGKDPDWTQDSRGCWCQMRKSSASGAHRRHKLREIDGWTEDAQGCWCQKGASRSFAKRLRQDAHEVADGEAKNGKHPVWSQDSQGCWCDASKSLAGGAHRSHKVREIDGWTEDSRGCWCHEGVSSALANYADASWKDESQYPSGWTKDAQGCFCQKDTSDAGEDFDTRNFDPWRHLYGWTQVSKSCWCFGLAWYWEKQEKPGWYYEHWERKDGWLYYDGVPYEGWSRDSKNRWYEI